MKTLRAWGLSLEDGFKACSFRMQLAVFHMMPESVADSSCVSFATTARWSSVLVFEGDGASRAYLMPFSAIICIQTSRRSLKSPGFMRRRLKEQSKHGRRPNSASIYLLKLRKNLKEIDTWPAASTQHFRHFWFCRRSWPPLQTSTASGFLEADLILFKEACKCSKPVLEPQVGPHEG